jgi:hypothetical protein
MKPNKIGTITSIIALMKDRLQVTGNITTSDAWDICKDKHAYSTVTQYFRAIMETLVREGRARKVKGGLYEIIRGSVDPDRHYNYRVIALKESQASVIFRIHEVYYDKGMPKSYSLTAAKTEGHNKSDLRWELEKMTLAFKDPVLWGGDKFPSLYQGNHR